MKQVDEDMLIIKAMVGDDFERMNNLIIEMQKSYQDYFRKSQQELVNAMSSMGAVIVHTNTRKNQHTLSCALKNLEDCEKLIPIQTNWLKDKIIEDLNKVKNTCDCDICTKYMSSL